MEARLLVGVAQVHAVKQDGAVQVVEVRDVGRVLWYLLCSRQACEGGHADTQLERDYTG